jgi:tetratricopeptide (TPR) repeat protein
LNHLVNDIRKYYEALECLDKFIEIDPNTNPGSSTDRVLALANLGEYEQAIKSYDKALGLNPNDEHTIHEKCISLKNLGKHNKAEKLVSKARDMGLDV